MFSFARPTLWHAMLWMAAGMSFFGLFAVLLPPGPSAPWLPAPGLDAFWMAGMMLAGAVFALLVAVPLGAQRVEIEGTTVRVRNLATLHRWRAFDLSEVTGLDLTGQGNDSFVLSLVVGLSAAPHRSWNRIDITSMRKTHGDGDLDAPVFVALVRCLARMHTDIEVGQLPPSYDGVLRRPRSDR
ncbi:hypothetical protein HSX11_27880 [Oxalobacteraceae bacterium]|nr:hypothetical protein [Oxalobacteraceae bacterium]